VKGTLVFDLETHEKNKLYSMPPEEFVRLVGYAWDDGEVVVTTSLNELKQQMHKARWIIGHNIHDFDLRAVFGVKSNIPMQLADEGRVYDTWTHAVLVNPAPYKSINRFGKPATYNKPEKMLSWFSLNEQAYQLGVPGKLFELKELAIEFGEGRTKAEKAIDGYGKIPVDDPRYIEYLKQDVRASRAVAKALMARGPLDPYALREQRIESRKACIMSNGVRVDVDKATTRRDQLKGKRDEIVAWLVEEFDFPDDPAKKQPWRSKQGKDAILQALATKGVTEATRPLWKRSEKTGTVSLGGEVLLDVTRGTEAEEIGTVLAELMGQRSLSQLTLDSLFPDGFVHPEITMLQRSGRWSTTKPGLTVWTSHGPNAIEKEYYLPDFDDHVLLEIDASNADARVVAWYSGDEAFAKRFEPGQDGHMINAWAAWGKDVVGTDKHDPRTAAWRQKAKPLGHGWSYGGGYKTLSAQTGTPEPEAKQFCEGMKKAFKKIIAWQDSVRQYARYNGYVINRWGRKMFVEKGREYTQAPALMGQSGTREIMCDALLAMPHHVVRTVKAQIHDALLFSVPAAKFEACRDYLVKLMTCELEAPPGGLRMDFPMEAGPAGINWFLSDHANLQAA
jgi:DNA polymerase family A